MFERMIFSAPLIHSALYSPTTLEPSFQLLLTMGKKLNWIESANTFESALRTLEGWKIFTRLIDNAWGRRSVSTLHSVCLRMTVFSSINFRNLNIYSLSKQHSKALEVKMKSQLFFIPTRTRQQYFSSSRTFVGTFEWRPLIKLSLIKTLYENRFSLIIWITHWNTKYRDMMAIAMKRLVGWSVEEMNSLSTVKMTWAHIKLQCRLTNSYAQKRTEFGSC